MLYQVFMRLLIASASAIVFGLALWISVAQAQSNGVEVFLSPDDAKVRAGDGVKIVAACRDFEVAHEEYQAHLRNTTSQAFDAAVATGVCRWSQAGLIASIEAVETCGERWDGLTVCLVASRALEGFLFWTFATPGVNHYIPEERGGQTS